MYLIPLPVYIARIDRARIAMDSQIHLKTRTHHHRMPVDIPKYVAIPSRFLSKRNRQLRHRPFGLSCTANCVVLRGRGTLGDRLSPVLFETPAIDHTDKHADPWFKSLSSLPQQ